jgi:hypothetical protein
VLFVCRLALPSPLWGGVGVGVGRLRESVDECDPPRDPHPRPPTLAARATASALPTKGEGKGG